jgi:putative phage-type endonuclease
MQTESTLTPEQMEIRKTGIGSSEIAILAGLDPYRSSLDLYARKVGLDDFRDSKYMRWGRRLETVIADEYADQTGSVLANPGTVRCPKRPLVIATPDRVVITPATFDWRKAVEIKTASARMADEWGDPGTDEVPQRYVCQVAWEMAATGLPSADLAVLIAGNDFRIYHLTRDLELEEGLVELAERFWRDHVEPRRPPLETAQPQGVSDYLKRAYPRDVGPVLDADEETSALALQYAQARSARDSDAGVVEELEARIKARIADAAGIRGAWGQITWKATKDRREIDWEAIAREAGATDEIIQKHTHAKAGARRFLPKFTG